VKKHGWVVLLIIAVLGLGLVGCDRRTQAEKDMDKVADEAAKVAKDAQKKLGL